MKRPRVKCWRWYETTRVEPAGGFPAVPGKLVFVTGKAPEAGPGWFRVNVEGGGRSVMHESRILHERRYS